MTNVNHSTHNSGGRNLLLILALLVLSGLFQQAQAAAADGAQKQAQPQSYQALLQTIEDDSRRAEFIRNLKLLIAARQEQQAANGAAEKPVLPAVSFLADRIDRLSRDVLDTADALLQIPALFMRVSEQLTHQEIIGNWLRVLIKITGYVGQCLAAGSPGTKITAAFS